MNPYESQIAPEFGELGEGAGEFGEASEFGEVGELLEGGGGEFGEYEAHEQFLGSILGSLMGGGEVSPLTEAQEIELAAELLEISSEQELEQFLGGLIKKVGQSVGSFVKSPVGRALGGVLKGVAKKALPVVGGALGSMVAPGIGTAIGSKLGSMASGLFELELEAMPQVQAEYEVARRVVGLAASAARNAALARPRPGVNPVAVARAAVTRAARTYAPGMYRQMIRSLSGGAGRPGAGQPFRRGGAMPRPPFRPGGRPFPSRPGVGGGPGAVAGPTAIGGPTYVGGPGMPGAADVGAQAPFGIPDDAFEPAAAQPGAPQMDGALSGRWVRRGRKIIVLGV